MQLQMLGNFLETPISLGATPYDAHSAVTDILGPSQVWRPSFGASPGIDCISLRLATQRPTDSPECCS